MNEQVIDDLYARALQSGYKKGRADFVQLIQSNEDVFNDMYQYVQSKGYAKDAQSFSSLVGKRTAPTVKKKVTASVSEPGSLVSPEPEVPVETAIAPATEAAEPATTLTGAADPDFFEERMEMISPQLIDRGDEDEVAQELTDVFKPYGFEVEPAGIGDAIKVTAGNGKSIEVDLDPFEMPKILSPFGLDFNTETETAEAKKLQDFLRENRQEGLDAPRRFVTNKQRDDEVKRINQKQKEINRSAQDYLKRKLEFQNKYPQFLTYDPEYIKNNPEEYQRFLNDRDSLEKEREFLVEIDQKAKEEGAQLDRLAGEYTEMLAQRGYWSGGVFRNEFIQGIAEIVAGAKDFALDTAYDPKFLMETDPEFFRDNYLKEAADKGYDVPSASDMTVDEFKAWMKTDKGIPAKESIAIQTSIVDTKLKRRKRGEPIDYEEALNAYSQYATSKNMEVTDGELAALRRGLDFLKDPESTPEAADLMYESFWGGALLGVTRSLPAILVPGGFITRTAAMYSQISSALEQEMAKDPDFRDISEAERFRLKLAIGSASSVLESLGVRNVLKQKGLLTGILMKALKKTPANVKGKAFNEVVMREINSAIGRGALVVTSAGLAEFETGFLQEGVDIGFKNVYNEMKGRDMFETPEGARDIFGRMLYAGAQEAVGGFVLGTPGAISAARRSYDFTAVDDATFEMFENVSSQTARGELTYRHMFYTNLQARINRGEISKADAQQEMDNLDEVIAVNRDIPSDLTVSQKKKALGILLRKKDLQEQIEGKDPILVKRQQEELNSLNRELDQILYGTPETDAIQEQGPESVDAPEPTRDSEAVGEGVPDIGEPTTEVEAQDDVTDEAPAPTTEVAVDEAPTEKQQKGLQRRIDRSKKDFAAATSLEEKAKALVRYLNSVSNSKGIASEEDAAWYEANKAELEAEGFVFDDIGDELADGKPADIRNEETSDAVPKGKIIIKAVVKPGRVVDGKAVSRPTYDVIRGTGTTAARDALVAELKALEDELTTDNFNEISPKLKAARKALKDYDDANFPSSKSVAAPKKSAPKKTVSEPTQEVTEEVAVEETVPVEVEPVTAQSARYAQLIEDTPDSVVELFENWTKSLFSPEIEAIENKEPSNRTRSESAKLAAVTRRMKKALAAAEAAGLDNSAQIELERAVRERLETQEAAAVVAENVSEPTQEVTEEEQVDIDEFFGEQDIEGVEKVSENLVINRKQKAPTADPKSQRRMNRVRQMSVKAAASIRKIAPEVKILIHESPEEYQRFAGEQTAGNYNPKTKTIHINLGKANLYTAPHEVFHALLLQTISTDSEALTVSRKMLESVRKVVDPNSQMAKDIDEFVARYGDAPTIQDEEYLAQLTGILTAEYRTLNKPAKNAVKDFLRKLAKMLGLEKYLGPEFLKTDEQVIDLLNTISRRMSEGEYIEAADVQAMGDILSEATPAEQAQAQREVRDFKRKERERKATEENLLNRSQEYVQDFDELERLNNEGVMFHFGPVDIQEVMPEKLRLMVSGYGIYFIDKAESPTTYSLYASRYGKRVTLVDGNGMNLVDSGSKISKEEFTTLMDTFNKEVAALDEVSPEITELSDYLNELDLDLQGANPTWYEMLTTMSPDLLPSDSDFFLGGVIDKAYNYTNPQKMFIAEVTAKALGYDGATSIIGKGSIEEHSVVNVWNFDKVNKNIISDEAVTPRMQVVPRQQVADAATSIQESLKFADKSSFPNKLEFKRALQERFDNEVYPLIKERYGVKDNRSNTDQGLKDYLVDAYLNETLTAIEAYPDALGWYDARITGAMSLMEKLHPELATDKDAASTFKIALAITSNGNKVYDNFVEANRQYEYFKENGKFDDTYSIGDQRAGILSTLAFTNKALESMSMADFTAFLTTKYRAGDLKYMKDGKKTPLLPGFAVDEEVYGASIFGPKIGNGFFMNLYGEFNQLTMDRWFMRQFGRLTGTLIDYDQKKVDAGTKRLNRAIKALAKRNAAKLSEMIPGWDKMSAEELSSKIQKASMDLKKRATFKSNPKLDEVRKAGNNLSKQVSAEVEAPRNSSQRKFINEVFTELQAKLKNDYDIDITIADLQAVNWYPEKALYQTFKADQSTKTGKVETSDNEQPDYESAAKKLVEEQGVSKKEIKEDEARRSKQLERNTANREAIEQRAGELNKDDIEASEVKRLKDKIISVKEDVTSSGLEEGVAPRQQLSDIATPLPRQQKSVREVVQQARDNNFKDAATKDFLKRKGVPTADIDKAIKTLDEVYARVMKEIDGVITKSQKRGVDFDTQLKNALAYLQGTKLYEDTTDIHREKLMREVRAKFDKKEKRAPSAKRILGNIKDVKKVTLKEKEALKMQLRLVAKTAKTTARALVVASNELTKSLKEMVKGGVITANQMSSVLRRFSRVDLFNPASIDSFLDYMAKIFADAEYGAKIARIKKLLPRAKKNIKSKIGVADVLGDTLTKLFNVNPTLIPMEMLEDYQNLLEMMGAAKKVLPLADINDVTEVANKLLNAVYEEVSMAEDLAEVFANYENKVIKDGKVDYAATVRAMIADETISEAEATVMIKYKSRIVESTTKEPKTEEELAEERAELMSAVDAAKVNVSRLVMDEERTLARQLAKLMRTEAIERLSNQQLETLLAVIDNINNGFVTHAANRLYVNMNALNNDNQLADSLQEADPLSISKFVAKIKGGITQNNKFFEAIKRRPLAYIDSLFGDFKTNRIYNSVFRPLAKAFDSMNVEIQRIEERLDNAENAVRKSFKRNPNKVRLSSYKRMTYMLQREFEANPDNGQVNPAADFIRATIDYINEGKSFFKGRDAEMLQQILDDFGVSVKDADGNEVIQIDSQKLYDSFNKAERNAIVVAEDINKSLASKASFTAAVIQGRRADILNQYAHHNVLSSSEQADKSTSISEIQKYNQSLRASTKAKNSIERTGAVTPLNFDVLTSVSRGAKMMLTDFYLTDPVRTSRKTISNTRKVLEERGNATKQDKEILNAIDQALELALDDVLTKTFTQGTMVDNIIQYISKTGYRVVLASVSRFGAEGLSNSGFVSLFAPKQMALGLSKENMKLSIGSGGTAVDILSALGSTQISRLFPDQMLSGRMIDTSVLGEKSGDKGGRAYGEVANKMLQIYNGVVKPGKEGVERVADGLISTPDKAVIRPLWFGSFEYKFEELTKKKPDMDKIAANDEAYMDANQKALDEATDYADQMTTFAGAADNPFKGLLKGKYPSSVKQSAMLQAFNISNSFMTRFLIYEFISAQIGTYAMMGRGMISKRQGAALLGAVTTRMVVYTLLTTLFAQIFKQAFGLGDEEEEKDIEKQFGQALASTAVSLIVGRDFGNIVKGLLNYGVENLNEEFLDELRDGDYDPYRDAIAYTFVPPDKEYKSNTLADYIRNLMGPFGPFYKMAEFGVKTLSADEKKDPAARIRQQRELNERLPLELLGNLGLIPLYRDIRALLLADIYKGMGKEKKGSSTGMTKAEKAQMKEYFPELYKMQMQMEEDMKNPELEKFEKEMKLLEKQLEESLKQR